MFVVLFVVYLDILFSLSIDPWQNNSRKIEPALLQPPTGIDQENVQLNSSETIVKER